jgi:hypothetical protein
MHFLASTPILAHSHLDHAHHPPPEVGGCIAAEADLDVAAALWAQHPPRFADGECVVLGLQASELIHHRDRALVLHPETQKVWGFTCLAVVGNQ